MDENWRAEHGSEARNSYSLRYSNCMLQTKFHIYFCNGDTMWICSFLFNWYNLFLSHQSYFKTSNKGTSTVLLPSNLFTWYHFYYEISKTMKNTEFKFNMVHFFFRSLQSYFITYSQDHELCGSKFYSSTETLWQVHIRCLTTVWIYTKTWNIYLCE